MHARGHVGKLAWGDTKIQGLQIKLRGQGDTGTRGDATIHGHVGSRAPTRDRVALLLSNEGAGRGLAPELVNIDDVFANTGDGDF